MPGQEPNLFEHPDCREPYFTDGRWKAHLKNGSQLIKFDLGFGKVPTETAKHNFRYMAKRMSKILDDLKSFRPATSFSLDEIEVSPRHNKIAVLHLASSNGSARVIFKANRYLRFKKAKEKEYRFVPLSQLSKFAYTLVLALPLTLFVTGQKGLLFQPFSSNWFVVPLVVSLSLSIFIPVLIKPLHRLSFCFMSIFTFAWVSGPTCLAYSCLNYTLDSSSPVERLYVVINKRNDFTVTKSGTTHTIAAAVWDTAYSQNIWFGVTQREFDSINLGQTQVTLVIRTGAFGNPYIGTHIFSQ